MAIKSLSQCISKKKSQLFFFPILCSPNGQAISSSPIRETSIFWMKLPDQKPNYCYCALLWELGNLLFLTYPTITIYLMFLIDLLLLFWDLYASFLFDNASLINIKALCTLLCALSVLHWLISSHNTTAVMRLLAESG